MAPPLRNPILDAPDEAPQENELGAQLTPTNELGGILSSNQPPVEDAPLAPISPRQQRESLLQNKILNYEQPKKPQGFWGKTGHILSTVGNIAGDIFAPAAMGLISGTQLHGQIENAGNKKELEGLEGQDAEETKNAASQANMQSEEGLRTIQGKHEQAETDQIENAPPKPVDLAQAYATAVQGALAGGRDPQTDPVVQHLADAITNIQKQPAPKGKEHVSLAGPKGPYAGAFDSASGKYYDQEGKEIANPIPYEKPQVTNINAADASIDRLGSRLSKPYQTALTQGQSQLEKIDAAKSEINGNAMSQAVGVPKVMTALVSGQGSGVRITQAELNAIAKARGLQGDVEGTINSWAGKGKLTPEQQKQLSGILDDAKNRIQQKIAIHSEALDKMNGAGSREEDVQADREARQRLNELETHGFYTGQKIPGKGTVVGFKDGKVQVDDAR